MGNIKKNLSYQILYQIINILIPLITIPYISRVLGAKGLGLFSYTQSIVNIFTLFAMLGIVNYGTRSIAECGQNYDKRSKVFWSIYLLQFITSMTMLILYILYLKFIDSNDMFISLLQGIYILAAVFDISWLFFGVEDFKTTIAINISVRLVSVILIYGFINSLNDLWIYCLIMSGSIFLSNINLWFFLKKNINLSYISKINISNIFSHLRPNLILFIPMLAMSIYHIMDKTMLGMLSTFEQTGLYYNADKVINMPLAIISGIQTVMLPRITSVINSGDKEKSYKIFNFSLETTTILTTAMAFGISAISFKFVPIFFGKNFEDCIPLIIALSPIFVIKGFTFTARMQYLIPNYKEDIFIKSVFIGAIVNLIVNAVLIPKYYSMGAVIGTLIAETSACIWQYHCMSKEIEIKKTIFKSLKYFLLGILMFIVVYFAGNLFNASIFGLLMQVFIGMLFYGISCILFWKSTNDPIFRIIKKIKE